MQKTFFKLASAISLCSVFLVACEESEPVDWIEVPLQERTYFGSAHAYQEGAYEILVLRESALEYKLGLNEGDAMATTGR